VPAFSWSLPMKWVKGVLRPDTFTCSSEETPLQNMMDKNRHNLENGSDILRTNERIKTTSEIFTPEHLVEEMIDAISIETLKNPNSTFLDPSAGSGNFLVGLKKRLLQYHTEDHIINHMLYSVELMEDNHKELCKRLGVSPNHPHYVCGDALTYDYSFGEQSEPVGVEKFYES